MAETSFDAVAGSLNSKRWQYLGSLRSGDAALNLPSDFTELIIQCIIDNRGDTGTIHLIKEFLSNNNKIFGVTPFMRGSDNCNAQISVSTTQIRVQSASSNNNGAACTIYVYYK